jgi:hypothetical protein
MTLPGTIAMTPSGNAAAGSDTLIYSQNASTEYTIGALTVSGPNGSNLSGTVSFLNSAAELVVLNGSESTSNAGTIAGNTGGEGSVNIDVAELTAANLFAGNYSVSSTISCAEAI